MNDNIILVVLAAGIGKRFWPITRSKIIFPFMGKDFIDYTLPKELPPEISRMVIITSPDTKAYFENHSYPLPYKVIVQKEANGMAGALLAAQNEIAGKKIFVLIADDLFDHSLYSEVINKSTNVFGVVAGWKVPHYLPLGYLKLENGRPLGVIEKPGAENMPSQYAVFGLHYYQNADRLLEEIKAVQSQNDDIYELAMTNLIKKEPFAYVPYDNFLYILKYPWHILPITQHILGKLKPYQGKNVEIRHNVSISGVVYMGDNVKIFENTKIIGPVYIGDNTIIGNNNLIRESHIGVNCVTGFSTEIARSYIGDNCWLHNNYIGDSVLESDIGMGGGSVTANFRLDEGQIHSHIKENKIATGLTKLGVIIGKNTRIGVNVSTMPGVKIGSGSFIGGGLTVDRDIPTHSFVTAKQELTIKENTVTSLPSRDTIKAKI